MLLCRIVGYAPVTIKKWTVRFNFSFACLFISVPSRMSHNKSHVSHIHPFIGSFFRFTDFDFWCFVHGEKNTFYFFPIIFISMVRCAGERSSFQIIVLPEFKKKPFRFQHDDKNTHFVIASTIAPTDQPFIFPGGMQRTNLQSQSFPDLSRKIDVRSMKGGGNVRPMYKSSKLPVASR